MHLGRKTLTFAVYRLLKLDKTTVFQFLKQAAAAFTLDASCFLRGDLEFAILDSLGEGYFLLGQPEPVGLQSRQILA